MDHEARAAILPLAECNDDALIPALEDKQLVLEAPDYVYPSATIAGTISWSA